jgi:hypothetical protein
LAVECRGRVFIRPHASGQEFALAPTAGTGERADAVHMMLIRLSYYPFLKVKFARMRRIKPLTSVHNIPSHLLASLPCLQLFMNDAPTTENAPGSKALPHFPFFFFSPDPSASACRAVYLLAPRDLFWYWLATAYVMMKSSGPIRLSKSKHTKSPSTAPMLSKDESKGGHSKTPSADLKFTPFNKVFFFFLFFGEKKAILTRKN